MDVLPEGGVVIVAPIAEYSWRVWPGGKIEFSFDSSRTWQTQKSGVTADLTGGSAPSGKVCWVVGKAGTILLTTDRGKHWKQLSSPSKVMSKECLRKTRSARRSGPHLTSKASKPMTVGSPGPSTTISNRRRKTYDWRLLPLTFYWKLDSIT